MRTVPIVLLIFLVYIIYRLEKGNYIEKVIDATDKMVDDAKRVVGSLGSYTGQVLKDTVDYGVEDGIAGFMQDNNEGHRKSEFLDAYWYQVKKAFGYYNK